MREGTQKKDEKDRARNVPFFARYLAGQEKDGDPTGGGDSRIQKRTLKFPSDGDDDDWAR